MYWYVFRGSEPRVSVPPNTPFRPTTKINWTIEVRNNVPPFSEEHQAEPPMETVVKQHLLEHQSQPLVLPRAVVRELAPRNVPVRLEEWF